MKMSAEEYGRRVRRVGPPSPLGLSLIHISSITEFWRRWHMTLSGWFREYVYIPLGGNRKGLRRQIFNLFVVELLTGIWHGANWNFICWGLYYFVLLALEKLFLLPYLKKGRVWPHLYTLFLVVVGWAMFVGCLLYTSGHRLESLVHGGGRAALLGVEGVVVLSLIHIFLSSASFG